MPDTTLSMNETPTTTSALPLVCVYVITFNGKRFLETCFRTLGQLTEYPNHQLILAENGSCDGSGEYVPHECAWPVFTYLGPLRDYGTFLVSLVIP